MTNPDFKSRHTKTSSNLRKITNAIVLSLAIVGGWADKSLSQEAKDDMNFHTPSKNIWCSYSSNNEALRCDIDKKKWNDWGCTNSGCYGSSFYIQSSGKAHPIKTSDTLIGSSNMTLAYGHSISLGKIKCVSESVGLTCSNPKGGKLHLNREFYSLR